MLFSDDVMILTLFSEVFTGKEVRKAIINYFRVKRGYVLLSISSLRLNCHLAILSL